MTDTRTALISSPIAPLYLKPERGGELDDEALYGMAVEILYGPENGFYRIRTPYRYESFCGEEHLCFDEAEIRRGRAPGKLKTAASPTLDVMADGNVQSGILITLTLGALIEVLDEGEKWTRVRLIGGREGFAKSSRLCPWLTEMNVGEARFRENVVMWAKRFLGAQYRWGGRTPLGVDCSGLCSQAYLINGVSIYRNASIKAGFPVHEIPRERMGKGDLLFFRGHVAMYIGGGRYIHSTGRAGDDGVVINSLDPAAPDYRQDLAEGILAVGSVF